MTTCTLHEALGAQWNDEHRDSLPNELSVEDVQMLFLATEFARHSRQICHWRKSLFSFVWKELLRAGFPASFREALVRAGVHDALSKMPYLASGTGDFETDAHELLAACRERHAFKSNSTSADALNRKLPFLQILESPALSTSRGALIYDEFPKWVGQHHEGLEEILSQRAIHQIIFFATLVRLARPSRLRGSGRISTWRPRRQRWRAAEQRSGRIALGTDRS